MSLEAIFSLEKLYDLVDDTLLVPFEAPDDLKSYSVESLGAWLPSIADRRIGIAHAVPPDAPPYWSRLKNEFRILLCTKDKRYADLRKKLEANARKSQLALVSIVAAAMGHYVGVAAGILVPFCALCLIAFLRMGREAFCRGAELLIYTKE